MLTIYLWHNGFHHFIYDYAALEGELLIAGSKDVRKSQYNKSSISELNLDINLPDREIQSLYVEAVPRQPHVDQIG